MRCKAIRGEKFWTRSQHWVSHCYLLFVYDYLLGVGLIRGLVVRNGSRTVPRNMGLPGRV
jgi:hypothetical protein